MAADHPKARLALYPAFETRDADRAREEFSQRNRHFRLEPVGGRYHLSSHTAVLPSLAISSMKQAYPRKSWLEADGRFFVLLLSYQGVTKYIYGGHTFTVGPAQGVLMPPDRESLVESSGGEDLLAIRIPAGDLLSDAQGLLGGRPLAGIEPLGIIEKGSAVWQMAEYMVDQLDQPTGIFTGSPLPGRDIVHAFRTALLQSTPNTCQALLDVENVRVAYWHVRRCKRAEEYMDAHLRDHIRLPVLAMVAGVTGNALEKSFGIYRQKRVMEVLKEKRIFRIRDELLSGQSGMSIGELRTAYLQHGSGRFAADYFELVGETPSETERKGKSRL